MKSLCGAHVAHGYLQFNFTPRLSPPRHISADIFVTSFFFLFIDLANHQNTTVGYRIDVERRTQKKWLMRNNKKTMMAPGNQTPFTSPSSDLGNQQKKKEEKKNQDEEDRNCVAAPSARRLFRFHSNVG